MGGSYFQESSFCKGLEIKGLEVLRPAKVPNAPIIKFVTDLTDSFSPYLHQLKLDLVITDKV